jgi:hypothetical protein
LPPRARALSLKAVADGCGLGRSPVAEALARLRKWGMVDWDRGAFGGTNFYRVRPAADWARFQYTGSRPGSEDGAPWRLIRPSQGDSQSSAK